MKKLFFLGALFAVGLGFTACSSDKDEVANASGQSENGGGNYIAISINLPNVPTSVTRTTTDNGGNVVDLNDGLATEYEVKNATLIIFDNSGNFVEARTIDTKPWTSSTDDHVTRVSTKVVQKVGGSVATGYQMLIILNNNGLINVPSGTTTLQVMKNGALTAFSGNYSDLFTESNKYFATTTGLNCGTMNTTGFYMANAPLADKQGSTATSIAGATVRVLVPITAVYETEAAAAAGTADQIYVERGMAKVTMDQVITTPTLSNSKIDGSTDLVGEVTGWTIDNTNPNSFLVRSTADHSSFLPLISNSTATGAAVYRYIGNTAITQGSPATYKYRTYFAKSANYDKSTSLNRVTTSTVFSDDFGETNPQYCFENTFSVADQDVNKTTLVQVAIQAKAGGVAADLYTVNGNKSSIYNLASLTTLIQSKALEYIEAQTGWVTSGTIASTEINVGTITVDEYNKVTTIALTCDPSSATVNAANFYKDGTGTAKTLPDAVYTYVLSETGDILKYVSGISYYNIRIKHFGDLLTPWKNLETAQPTTGNIYPTANADINYLGRYGVLRNNWYNLKVNSIRSLGEATPHTATWTDTPDDELDNYISFQINILSWAKHVTQNADL
ncbi:MAG: Mfa1 fimbrilin C-terminal domain-containing protein [Prevotella sp.]|nr:Mfa1 fimbrilin C-terminal domain-containing protein [Prevotella sp.]